MVVFPGGSHQLSSTGKPSHRVDYHRRLIAWLQRWV
jgi:dipeptidyl aminopeptidase/acylaminoacyl peptidase